MSPAKQGIRHRYSLFPVCFLAFLSPWFRETVWPSMFSYFIQDELEKKKKTVVWQINSSWYDFFKVGHWADYIQPMFCKRWILHGAFILRLKRAILFLSLLHSRFFVIPAYELLKTLKVMTGMILSFKSSKFIFRQC